MINMSLALEAFPQMLPDPWSHWHKIPQSQVETPTTVQWESLASQWPESRGGIPPSTTQNKLWGVRHLPSERARTSYRTLRNLPLISHRSKWGDISSQSSLEGEPKQSLGDADLPWAFRMASSVPGPPIPRSPGTGEGNFPCSWGLSIPLCGLLCLCPASPLALGSVTPPTALHCFLSRLVPPSSVPLSSQLTLQTRS